jgi:hypothetical protein
VCAGPESELFCDWSLERTEAEARKRVAQAAVDGSWRSLVEPLQALRDRAELLEAFIAEVERQIG